MANKQIVKMDKSILNYFKIVMNLDNQGVQYKEVMEKEFKEELTKSLNCGIANKEVVWID